MTAVTPRQAEVLRFIAWHTQAKGYPPTLREIGNAVGIRSTNGVQDHLMSLERKGMLNPRPPATSRGITLTAAGRAFVAASQAPVSGEPIQPEPEPIKGVA